MENKWVLKDGDTYFKSWTGIGPAGTKDVEEAQLFDGREDALHSPAFTFSLMSYEPTEIATK